MMVPISEIDIKEGLLRRSGRLLEILLLDRTTKKNIIWATESYLNRGKGFSPTKQIRPELITGIYNKLIQPRAAKTQDKQRERTKDKAEVFTPLKIVKQMNNAVDDSNHFGSINKANWQDYLLQNKLEIACGEAPFIVSRYEPTSTSDKLIPLNKRVGFLDKKLQTISKYIDSHSEWLNWTKLAYQSSYGYEWQGDSLLIARENLFYTFIDFYKEKFDRRPVLEIQEEIAEIISWNIFQMDGIKYVIPMSCHHESKVKLGELALFWETPDEVEEDECEGCKFNRPTKHNGKYVRIMDWKKGKTVRFVDLLM